MEKEEIIKEGIKLLKDKKNFDKVKKKFTIKYKGSYINNNFSKDIECGVFIYGDDFYQPKTLKINRDEVVIECEKWGLFHWSSSSLNKVTINLFKIFKEVSEDEIILFCSKLMKKHIERINKLEEDTLKRLLQKGRKK